MLDRCRKDGRIVYYDHAIPMPRFIRDVDALSRGLVNLGLKKGDVITVYLPTCPQSVAAFIIKGGTKGGGYERKIRTKEKINSGNRKKSFYGKGIQTGYHEGYC